MRQDAWRGYLEMALGLTEASRKQATKAVKRALGKGGATAEQLQGLAEELLKTSAANREALTRLVNAELERALNRVGLARADEVAELTTRVRELENELRVARAATPAAPAAVAAPATGDLAAVPATEPFGAGAAEPAAPAAARPRKVVKKAAKQAAPAPAEPAAATGPVKTAPVKKVAAKQAPVKKAPARKAAKKAGS